MAIVNSIVLVFLCVVINDCSNQHKSCLAAFNDRKTASISPTLGSHDVRQFKTRLQRQVTAWN